MSHQAPNFRQRNKWLWLKTDGHCAYCGAPFASFAEMTDDHIVPRSRGGSHDRLNRVPCCKPCNSSKGARPVSYLRDVLQRRLTGRPAFTSEQKAYLDKCGFQFPDEGHFQLFWEKIGNSFDGADHG